MDTSLPPFPVRAYSDGTIRIYFHAFDEKARPFIDKAVLRYESKAMRRRRKRPGETEDATRALTKRLIRELGELRGQWLEVLWAAETLNDGSDLGDLEFALEGAIEAAIKLGVILQSTGTGSLKRIAARLTIARSDGAKRVNAKRRQASDELRKRILALDDEVRPAERAKKARVSEIQRRLLNQRPSVRVGETFIRECLPPVRKSTPPR